MKCKRTQLDSVLADGMPLCSFVSGDELLLVHQCVEKIRARALSQGEVEHVHHVIINEEQLIQTLAEVTTGSLFASKRFCEVHLELPRLTPKIGQLLHKLVQLGDSSMPVLLVQAKRDKAHANKDWVKFCVANGIWVELWSLNEREHLAWLQDSLSKYTLSADSDGLQTLFELTVGNLVASHQEIQKLGQVFSAHHVLTRDDILSCINDNAKFSLFQLLDDAFEGKKQRVLHGYQVFLFDNVDPIVIYSQLVRQLNELLQMSLSIGEGNRHQIAQKLRLWPAKKATYEIALRRLKAPQINRLLRHCAKLEALIKGMVTGVSPHIAMQGLLLAVAGEKTPALASFVG